MRISRWAVFVCEVLRFFCIWWIVRQWLLMLIRFYLLHFLRLIYKIERFASLMFMIVQTDVQIQIVNIVILIEHKRNMLCRTNWAIIERHKNIHLILNTIIKQFTYSKQVSRTTTAAVLLRRVKKIIQHNTTENYHLATWFFIITYVYTFFTLRPINTHRYYYIMQYTCDAE